MSDWQPIIQGAVKELQRLRDGLREQGIDAELVRPPGAKTNG